MATTEAGWSDVERLLGRVIGDLVALEETVRTVGRQPHRLVAMREELEEMHRRVRSRLAGPAAPRRS